MKLIRQDVHLVPVMETHIQWMNVMEGGRAITVPEAWATGCDTDVEHTCPKYMHNYLLKSDSHGGTITGNESSSGYWTMNAHKDYSYFSWYVDCSAQILNQVVVNGAYGARAVIVINK